MEFPSAKVLVSAFITFAGALVVVVAELQAGGVELPSIVVMVSAVLAAVAGYLKRETNPSSSAIGAAGR